MIEIQKLLDIVNENHDCVLMMDKKLDIRVISEMHENGKIIFVGDFSKDEIQAKAEDLLAKILIVGDNWKTVLRGYGDEKGMLYVVGGHELGGWRLSFENDKGEGEWEKRGVIDTKDKFEAAYKKYKNI